MKIHLMPALHLFNSKEPIIERFIDMGCKEHNYRYSVNDCISEIIKAEKQLWVIKDNKICGIVITGIIEYPSKKCGMIDLCAGEDFELWAHLITNIESWMKCQGCDQMIIIGRHGFSKILSDYRRTQSVFEKEL